MSTNIKISLALIILFMISVLSLFINKLTTPRYLSAPELLVNGFYQFPNPKNFSNFQIISSNNTILNKDTLMGKWTLIYFGFTRCPAECPVAMSLIKNLYSTLDSKGFNLNDKQALLITIDPENDAKLELKNIRVAVPAKAVVEPSAYCDESTLYPCP